MSDNYLRLVSKMRAKLLAAACVVIVLDFSAHTTEARPVADQDCLTRVAHVANPPAFRDFPAAPSAGAAPARLQLTTPAARRFRTLLRDGVARGPNFAGPYSVVVWGCGSSCSDLAIVDNRTGRVHFDPSVRDISGETVGDEPGPAAQPAFSSARFQLGSRLLVIVGMPNEDDARDGVAYYDWTGSRLKLLRFVPRLQACTAVSGRR